MILLYAVTTTVVSVHCVTWSACHLSRALDGSAAVSISAVQRIHRYAAHPSCTCWLYGAHSFAAQGTLNGLVAHTGPLSRGRLFVVRACFCLYFRHIRYFFLLGYTPTTGPRVDLGEHALFCPFPGALPKIDTHTCVAVPVRHVERFLYRPPVHGTGRG